MSIHARQAVSILAGNGPGEGDVVIQAALGGLFLARVQGQRSLGAFPSSEAALQAIRSSEALAGLRVWQSDGEKTVEVT